MRVVGGVRGVGLSGSMTGEQGAERFVEDDGGTWHKRQRTSVSVSVATNVRTSFGADVLVRPANASDHVVTEESP